MMEVTMRLTCRDALRIFALCELPPRYKIVGICPCECGRRISQAPWQLWTRHWQSKKGKKLLEGAVGIGILTEGRTQSFLMVALFTE